MNLFEWTYGLFGDIDTSAAVIGSLFAISNLIVATFFRIAFRGRFRLTLVHRANAESTADFWKGTGG